MEATGRVIKRKSLTLLNSIEDLRQRIRDEIRQITPENGAHIEHLLD
jgi:hypothetical protein